MCVCVFETSLSKHSFCSPSENTHEVVLKKSLSGLGFSFNISQLRSGPDRGSVVRIKRLFPGQPALESGLLREGDIILSVNKEPVKDLSYQVAGQEFGFWFLHYLIGNNRLATRDCPCTSNVFFLWLAGCYRYCYRSESSHHLTISNMEIAELQCFSCTSCTRSFSSEIVVNELQPLVPLLKVSTPLARKSFNPAPLEIAGWLCVDDSFNLLFAPPRSYVCHSCLFLGLG